MQSKVRQHRGFTLLEAILFLVVFSIVAVAAGGALQALSAVPSANNRQVAISTELVDKLEELRATSFDSLPVGTSFSDTTTINGVTYARTVTIALADADSDGVVENDFKQITITIDGRSCTTWVSKP